jgi:hypothetical protein
VSIVDTLPTDVVSTTTKRRKEREVNVPIQRAVIAIYTIELE